MSQTPDAGREHPSTYFVQDRSNLDEMTRLELQDQILTAGMGGVLPEQPHPEQFRHVLDVGCGTGGWLIQTAREYPSIKRLIGVDISKKMVDYARRRAEAEGVGDRVQFYGMDALRMLEFPDDSFDLVTHRLAMSWLRIWDWPVLLREYVRVTQEGGIVRITESLVGTEGTSAAGLYISDLLFQAFVRAGHFFRPEPDGVTGELPDLLRQVELQEIQTRESVIQFRGGTREGLMLYEDAKHLSRNIVPFLRKWIRLPENYEQIREQMLADLQQPDCVTLWRLVTVWGRVPPKNPPASSHLSIPASIY